MPLITINDKKLSSQIIPQSSINDVMNMILDDSTNEHEVITNVSIDGKEIDADDQLLVTEISHYNHIDFTTKSAVELAFEAIDSCKEYIDVIIAKIYRMADCYKANDHIAANRLFAELVDIIDLFLQLQSQINVVLKQRFPKQYKKSEATQQLEIHLVAVLKSLIPAKESNDIIMLCDLLEYELTDNLLQWKSKVLPNLAKLGTN